jgi:PIN domain nuclease of toxin-antitoxin system
VRVLLNTHALLWFLEDSPHLSNAAKQLLEDAVTDAYISVASLWEIAIKIGLHKLQIGEPFDQLFPAQLQRNNIELLGVTVKHLTRLTTLPLRHRDPFDRMLIAQALEEQLVIVGADVAFDVYAVERVW